MPRVKRGVMHVKRRKNLLKTTKGYIAGRKNKIRLARVAMIKAGVFAFRDRKNKKRTNRALWNLRINAALREKHGLSYSKFIHLLKQKNVTLNRKVLSELAAQHESTFDALVNAVK